MKTTVFSVVEDIKHTAFIANIITTFIAMKTTIVKYQSLSQIQTTQIC